MKHLVYRVLQVAVRIGFYFYYKRIRIRGMEPINWDQPMLLLPNHQNALIDPLIIAVYAPKKTYFLTRSDVFVNAVVRSFFEFLKMLPIYRMRDGRDNLSRNLEVFDRCGQLLAASETILVFPEANHNLQRRVRPLSKGFTRILFHTLEKHPHLSISLIPVGVNYVKAEGFPDSAAFYFGEPYGVSGGKGPENEREMAMRLRAQISNQLKGLTTHIPLEMDYDQAINTLNLMGADYLNPQAANAMLLTPNTQGRAGHHNRRSRILSRLWRGLFVLLNLLPILIWRVLVKPRIEEPEFISTHRFLFAFLFFPLAYLFTLWLLVPWLGISLAMSILGGHILFNLAFVKFY